MTELIIKKYTGVVAIIGKPNVGKSTLINHLVDDEVSIVNQKPQTTRDQIASLYETEDTKILFLDTPGFHTPKNKLDIFLNKEAKSSLETANLVYFLTDLTREVNQEDYDLLDFIKRNYDENVFLLVTKYQEFSNDKIEERISNLKQVFNFIQTLKVNAFDKNDLLNLLELTKQHLEKQPSYLNLDLEQKMYKNSRDSFLVQEIIRKQCLDLLKEEVPYGVAVLIEDTSYDELTNVYAINACIVVEKESQKAIVIGKGGKMIKDIGTNSRRELLNIFDTKIMLKLFVKVDKDWRNNETKLKEFGYFKH